MATGIVDPTKVVRSALLNASSIASLLLTTVVSIGDEKERAGRSASGETWGEE